MIRTHRWLGVALWVLSIGTAQGGDVSKNQRSWGTDVKTTEPPPISSFFKPPVLKRILENKEIVVHAALDDAPGSKSDGELKQNNIYASMLVGASVREAYSSLTDYKLYAKLVPFIESAIFSPITHILLLDGGIWSFRLSSQVLFAERPDRWIHFDIVGGHFKGLSGNIYFESQGERGTLIYLRGEQIGRMWPPTFVIERGAEIVFGFTAQRMRSYIESTKKVLQVPQGGAKIGNQEERQIPQPRGHL